MRTLDKENLNIELNLQRKLTTENSNSNEQLIKSLFASNKNETSEKPQTTKVECDTSDFRLEQIKAAFAILHLNKSEDDFLLLRNILKGLLSYESLLDEECKFLSNFWENLDEYELPDDVLCLLFEFSYLYEKPILKSATYILRNESFKPNDELERIKNLCRIGMFKNIVNNLLCDLFVLSNYNEKLITLLRFFK